MTIADDDQNPRPQKKLAQSLGALSALRNSLEKRLAEEQKAESKPAPEKPLDHPPPLSELLAEPAPEKAAAQKPEPPPPPKSAPQPPPEAAKETIYDPAAWARIMTRIAEQTQNLTLEFLERNKDKPPEMITYDPAHFGEVMMGLTNSILRSPERVVDAQLAMWQGYVQIWQTMLTRLQGKPMQDFVKPPAFDKRFMDREWQNNWLFDFLKQLYLLTSQQTEGLIKQETEKLDPKLARKLEFYTRQTMDAISPTNFWLTNPQVLRSIFESGGDNLIKGFENLLQDLERGHGHLVLNLVDQQAFKVGENLAYTPGKVVFQNELIQLIQYAPLTETVHRVPLLIIPPWINKFYILDLREKNSFIHYLVAQGHTVFCVSWVNPDKRYAQASFDDYMQEGMLTAMAEVKRITREEDINTLGYCIGGTLQACTLAYLKAAYVPPKGLPKIASATYLVTMIDFAEPGDLGVFVDEDTIKIAEERMREQGFMDATTMATVFNLLRANDLIWSHVVNNYLLGKGSAPFDILYWNSDSTNLPAAMQSYYLRNMYLHNNLIQPNALSMKGVPIDIRAITVPSFLLSTREDHIAPWRSTYAATQIYQGPVKFMLAASGHIAGIINPPGAKKYGYWTNDCEKCPAAPEDWLKDARPHDGSWWPEWLRWLDSFAGEQVPAREVKNGLEDAPGSYVKVRAT
jgi:polyhydroxyalkanoate synthase